MKELGFGLIGCGVIANFHAKALEYVEGAHLVGATDGIKEKGLDFCKQYHTHYYESLDQMLADPNIDVCCVCTPSGVHAQNALDVIAAGKHVVVEKPLALNVADCEAVVQAAQEKGVAAISISQTRFTQGYRLFREALEQGKLGKVVLADLSMKYFRSKEYFQVSPWRGTWKFDGGGALMNQGIHGVDFMTSLMGKVKSVTAYTRTLLHDIETEDTAVAILEFESGALGVINAATSVSPGYPRVISIAGSEGAIELTESALTKWDIPGESIASASDKYVLPPVGDLYGAYRELYEQLSDFVNAIRTGTEPAATVVDGKKAVEIICAIYESSQTGKTVYFD